MDSKVLEHPNVGISPALINPQMLAVRGWNSKADLCGITFEKLLHIALQIHMQQHSGIVSISPLPSGVHAAGCCTFNPLTGNTRGGSPRSDKIRSGPAGPTLVLTHWPSGDKAKASGAG